MKYGLIQINRIYALQRRWHRMPAYVFARNAIIPLFIALVVVGCGRDSQFQSAPADAGASDTTSTSTVEPIANGEPQLEQVKTDSAGNSPAEPATGGSAFTETVALTETASPTATTLSSATGQVTTTGSLSMSNPLTRTAALTDTTEFSAAADLAAQLGMTVSSSISGSVTITAPLAVQKAVTGTVVVTDTVVITDALNSPLPTPQTTVLLPTPTPGPASVPAPAVMPGPTPDGVERTVRVPILMYHYLSEPPADADIYRMDLSVTPERFAAHLDAMQDAGYTAISLYDLLDNLVLGAPLPEKPVVITFDDGYRDTYMNAFPLLRERGMTASFFVITDFINEERPEYLSWEMAREMAAGGMYIESHARNHVSLKDKDIDYLVWQALGSLESIEREVGVRPRFISYPAGEYDQQTIDLFHSANFWAGLTTVQGATHSSDDLFQLRRVRVRGTTEPEELIRLLGLDW